MDAGIGSKDRKMDVKKTVLGGGGGGKKKSSSLDTGEAAFHSKPMWQEDICIPWSGLTTSIMTKATQAGPLENQDSDSPHSDL